jgi:hypothetical protein
MAGHLQQSAAVAVAVAVVAADNEALPRIVCAVVS